MGRDSVSVFVDTNIYLDFYRAQNEANLSLLRRLKEVEDRIICTYQVEMEFLKNRQTVLLQSIKAMQAPKQPPVPAIFIESKTGKGLQTATEDAKKKTKLLKDRVTKLFNKPRDYDDVYQALEGVFQSQSDMVLTRDMDERQAIKRRALRRFLLGYAPRKSGDTSFGDALNWEWIVSVAKSVTGKTMIVSRDSDYGCEFNKSYYPNDQLKQEFGDRVGKRRPLLYTQKLSDALKLLDVAVPEDEVQAEEEAISHSQEYLVEVFRKSKKRRKRRRLRGSSD